jgi:hypothetical protein
LVLSKAPLASDVQYALDVEFATSLLKEVQAKYVSSDSDFIITMLRQIMTSDGMLGGMEDLIRHFGKAFKSPDVGLFILGYLGGGELPQIKFGDLNIPFLIHSRKEYTSLPAGHLPSFLGVEF